MIDGIPKDAPFWDWKPDSVEDRLCVVVSGGKYLGSLPSRKHRVGEWTPLLAHALKFSVILYADHSGVYGVDAELTKALSTIKRYAVPACTPDIHILAPYVVNLGVIDPQKLHKVAR